MVHLSMCHCELAVTSTGSALLGNVEVSWRKTSRNQRTLDYLMTFTLQPYGRRMSSCAVPNTYVKQTEPRKGGEGPGEKS